MNGKWVSQTEPPPEEEPLSKDDLNNDLQNSLNPGNLIAEDPQEGVGIPGIILRLGEGIVKWTWDGINWIAEEIRGGVEGSGVKPGSLTGDINQVDKLASPLVEELVQNGNDVEILPEDNINKVPDIKINGVETEIKVVETIGENTIKNRIERAEEQSSGNILIDARKANFSSEQVENQIERAQGNLVKQGKISPDRLKGHVFVILKGGIVTY